MEINSAEPKIITTDQLKGQMRRILQYENVKTSLKNEIEEYQNESYVPFRLLKEIHDVILDSGEKKTYLHEMLAGTSLYLPTYEAPLRNPELEARIQKLKAEQENRRYESMVKNVSMKKEDHQTVGEDMKELNRQIISVVNFVITVGAAFAFGYKGTEYAVSGPNSFAFQLMAGLTLGTLVFFADLYFLVKYS